jgi:VanZ family protein
MMYKKLFRIFLTLSAAYAVMIFYMSSRSEQTGFQKIGSGLIQLVIDTVNNNTLLKEIGSTLLYEPANYAYHNMDKVMHVGLYFGFGIFLFLTFKYYKNTFIRRYAAIFAIIAGLTYGILDEFHQSFVPGRTASIADVAADGIGLVLAQVMIIAVIFIHEKYRRKTVTWS